MLKKGISVVIASYNGAARIKPTLQHLLNQKINPNLGFEILVIDNNSNDGFAQISQQILDNQQHIPYKVLLETQQGASFAKEKGIITAQYQIVLLVDDDNWLCDTYLQTLYNIFEAHPEVGIVGGCGIAAIEDNLPLPKWMQIFANSYALDKQAETKGYIDDKRGYAYGAGLAFRKNLWLTIKNAGFEHLLACRKGSNLSAGGDPELCFALRMTGCKAWYDPALTFYHYMPKQRITYQYFKALFKGFGDSLITLKQYQLALKNQSRPWAWEVIMNTIGCPIFTFLPLLKGNTYQSIALLNCYTTFLPTIWFNKHTYKNNQTKINTLYHNIKNNIKPV